MSGFSGGGRVQAANSRPSFVCEVSELPQSSCGLAATNHSECPGDFDERFLGDNSMLELEEVLIPPVQIRNITVRKFTATGGVDVAIKTDRGRTLLYP